MLKKIWQNLAIVTLIGAGLALLWGFFAAWGISKYEERIRSQSGSETLAVDANGDAWIQVHNYRRLYSTKFDFPYRTLDGKPIEQPVHDYWLSPCRLAVAEEKLRSGARLVESWGLRVTRVTNAGRELWFLVHNGEQKTGRAYMIGYDRLTKLPVGYCGLAGFRTELPPEDQWFPIKASAMGYGQGGYAVTSSHKDPRISIASAEGWFEFDVKQRFFRVIDDTQPYESVGVCKIPRPFSVGNRAELDEREQAVFDQMSNRFSPADPEVFAARLQGRIVVQNPQHESDFEFVIPEEYRDRHIDLYFVSEDLALLETSQGQWRNQESLLVWTNAKGEVQDTKPIAWKRYRGTSGRETSTCVTLAMPIPLAMGTVYMCLLPFADNMPDYAEWEKAGYAARLSFLLADGWPALVGLSLVVACLTWCVVRWHRRYARPCLWAWATAVLFLGVTGFFCELVYHGRGVLEECEACSKQAPRNRDTCALCQQPFPEPKLIGTEVFA